MVAARNLFREPVRLFSEFRITEEAVDIEEARPGEGALVRDMPAEFLVQVAQQFDLKLAVRREIGVPTFGRDWTIALSVPGESGHAKSGAGGDQSAISGRRLVTFVQGIKLLIAQTFDAIGCCYQVVDEIDSGDTDRLRESVAVYVPGEIRRLNAPSDNGSGDTKTCSFHFGICVEVQLEDRVKRFIL